MKKCLIALSFLGVLGNTIAYDVVDRYKVLEDKFKTEEMLRPFGHDFLIDINGGFSSKAKNFADDIDETSKVQGTISEKITKAQEIMNKYDQTEQTIKVGVNVGVPIFSFTAWGVKIVPDFRLSANVGANVGIQTETLTAELASTLVGNEVDPAVKNEVALYYDGVGTVDLDGDGIDTDEDLDIVRYICNQKGIPDAACDGQGKYYKPADSSVPTAAFLTKMDFKGGILWNFFKDNWFGHVNTYLLHRTDLFLRLTAESVARKVGFTDLGKELNSQLFFMTDYKLGYKWGRYTIAGILEEIKIARISDNIDKAGELKYGTDPLFRLHADATFKLPILNLVPFMGLHKRSGYDLSDGMYAGLDVGAYFLGDRLGAQVRAMVDSEHITLSPRFKLWVAQLEYSLKQPMSSKKDDVKISTIHSLDFRLFF